MQRIIEWKDLSLSGKTAVACAMEKVVRELNAWGFECENTPFSDPPIPARKKLEQALVNFLVETNRGQV